MNKYRVTQTLKAEARGDTEAEKDTSYEWLKRELHAAYGSSHTVTDDDTEKSVTVALAWDGEQ